MKFLSRHVLWGLGFSMLLAACGGGGGGSDGGSGTGNISRPTARISASATSVNAGDTVTLDGAASTPANGNQLSYQWNVTQRPAGSVAALTMATTATTGFQPDLPGNYSISLVVRDAANASNEVSVNLEVRNPDPVAVVLPELVQLVNTTVQLDGTASQAPAGGQAADLRFNWTLVEKPGGSNAKLDNLHLSQPRFVADVVGLYRATLVVTHGSKSSQPATVKINVNQMHTAPVAKPGADLDNVVRGERVQLDGSASTHASGSNLQYRWFFAPAGRPWGSKAELQGSNTAKPVLVPDFAGNYTVTLVVYDGTTTSSNDIRIKVVKPDGSPNAKPVGVITRPFLKSFESELATSISLTATYSHNPDGTTLTREWTLVSAPSGFDSATNWKGTSFIGTHYGDYVVRLRVRNGDEATGVWSDPVTATYTVRNGANRPPVAKASIMGSAGAIGVGTTVTITAEGSTDPDNNRMTYNWTMLDKPDGSTAKLSNATAVNPSFVADKPGPYRFSLIVTDEHGEPSTDGISSLPTELNVMVKTKNNPPIARLTVDMPYTQEQPLVIGKTGRQVNYGGESVDVWNSFSFKANGYDPDGDALTYLWTLSREPAGSQLQLPEGNYFCGTTGSASWPGAGMISLQNWLSQGLAARNWTCPDRFGLAPSAAGAYEVQLALSDGMAFAGPFVTTLHAVERQNYPSLLLEYLGSPSTSGSLSQTAHPNMLAQQLFPYASIQSGAFPIWGFEFEGNTTLVTQRYRLTASGGDYTIADLAGTSVQSGYVLSFQGLSNNQVIRKGQSVEFSLVLQVPSPVPSGQEMNKASEGMQWSFRIAEKNGWTFSHKPYIYPF